MSSTSRELLVDQLKNRQIQVLYFCRTRAMERARRLEQLRIEGTSSATSELMRSTYIFGLKAIEAARKMISRIPTPILDEDLNNRHTE